MTDRRRNIGAIIGRPTTLGLVHCESLSLSLVAKSRSSSTRSALDLPLRVTPQGPKCVADENIDCPLEGTRIVTLRVVQVTLGNEHLDLRYP